MKYVTIEQLSKLLGLSKTTLDVHLARFDKYMVKKNSDFFYTYTPEFLTALKDFYEQRMRLRGSMYAIKYFKVAFKLEKLIEKEKAAV